MLKNSSWQIIISAGLILFATVFWHLYQTDYSIRQNEHRRKFGAIYMTLNNPFYEVVDDEIRTAVENRGDILISRDPALSVEHQIEEIRDLIQCGVELIFINPVDWHEVEPALKMAYNARVPVIAIDTNVEDDRFVECTIVSSNYQAGVQCGEHLLKHASGGRIALLKHSQAISAVERIQGFRDTIAENPNFQIVDEAECLGQLEFAMPATEKMLQRHPDINIIMALNDPAAMGAVAALQSAGRLGNVLVYGVDGVSETKEMIASKRMSATVMQSPRMLGRIAVDRAYKILNGEQVEPLIQLPTKLFSSENLNAFNHKGWD